MLKKGHITIIASDFKKSLNFYTKTLGFKLVQNFDDKYASIEAQGLSIGIHPKEENHLQPKPGNTEGIQIGFAVDNIKEATKELKSKGVKFTKDIFDDGWGFLAIFSDPDSNTLYIGEQKKDWK